MGVNRKVRKVLATVVASTQKWSFELMKLLCCWNIWLNKINDFMNKAKFFSTQAWYIATKYLVPQERVKGAKSSGGVTHSGPYVVLDLGGPNYLECHGG